MTKFKILARNSHFVKKYEADLRAEPRPNIQEQPLIKEILSLGLY
jgi:hypothetical protein